MKRKTRAKPEPQVAEPAEPQASTEPEQEILVYGLPKKHAKFLFARVLSTLHAVVCTVFFLWYFPIYRSADISTQYECREIWKPVYYMTTMFVTYLVWDSFLPGMNGVYVFHHVLYGLTSIAQLVYGRSCYPFTWLISGEASTIVMNLRWYMISSGKTEWIDAVNILFAATFFLTRIVLYSHGLYEFLWNDPNLGWDVFDFWQPLTPVCLVSGYALNLYWFFNIFEKAMGAGAPPKTKKL